MKSVLYVSRAIGTSSGSNGLADIPTILLRARKYNRPRGITGLLVYEDGFYLQVLQGPAAEVDALHRKIWSDTRHRDIFLLVDAPAQKLFFEGHSMKLTSGKADNSALIDFLDHYSSEIHVSTKTTAVSKVLKKFGYSGHVPLWTSEVEQESDSDGLCEFKLAAWPDFDQIEPSFSTLDACAVLLKKWTDYSTLLTSVFDGDKVALNQLLRDLDVIGDLTKRKRETLESLQPVPPYQIQKTSFYSKMKSFVKSQLPGFR